ncbi:putative universal stress protein [Erysiphe neolycopersici]|uniref:Putative universal stress protein n=1 Tax=Erysiphe neolycopersici TaxID=212602 RepID=A0A420HXR6_9PEZI|nr:putative universal stress protein [Erysiphe neolycopersici]
MARKPQSLESVLDEERRHVLALLEEARIGTSSDSIRSENGTQILSQPVRSMLHLDLPTPSTRKSTSISSIGETSPLIKPVRSMLDINPIISPIKNTSSLPDLNATKFFTTSYRSMLDVSQTGKSPRLSFDHGSSLSPRTLPVRSMLDVSPSVQNYLFSPKNHRSTSPRRSSSRGVIELSPTTMFSLHSSEKNLKSQFARISSNHKASRPTINRNNSHTRISSATMVNMDPESACNPSSNMPSDASGPLTPKRSAQAGKRSSMPGVMMDAVKHDYFSLKDSDKHKSSSKNRRSNSRSPHGRFRMMSKTPKIPETTKISINERIDTSRRLQRRRSDANLTRSSGVKLSLPKVRRRTFNGTTTLASESGLRKETIIGKTENAIILSSDDSESDGGNVLRGRNIVNESTNEGDHESDIIERQKESDFLSNIDSLANEESQEVKKNLSLENDKEFIPKPEVIITEPSKRLLTIKNSNHFLKINSDDCDSRSNTSHDLETEAVISDIKHAQKLPINATACISTPATKRCVRSIHRGDFIRMQQEARDNQRRVRKYLVAVDLSEEAAHALEWTIGTVLRDGDTLLAIYCIDEEIGIYVNDSSSDVILQEQISGNPNSNNKPTIPSLTSLEPMRPQSNQAPGSRTGSTSEIFDRNPEGSRAEQQRHKAVQEITDKVSKLLRRTNLQVKVVIEVIHCKSPKHLITEVIDFVSPTLVILGSRGRSALKGFILGSFSNYIVTKSSVPVMVARKRLRNPTKYKRPSVRLANNIENPHQVIDFRTLTTAKVE